MEGRSSIKGSFLRDSSLHFVDCEVEALSSGGVAVGATWYSGCGDALDSSSTGVFLTVSLTLCSLKEEMEYAKMLGNSQRLPKP
uniref:Uncharacterized protein n=1 Tax=Setaria digitata TaxID=48799 RepID=A0A915PWI0_9BILA